MHKLLVTEFAELPPALLQRRDIMLDYRPDLWRDVPALYEALTDADALIVRNATQVTRDLMRKAPRLRAIGRLGTGLDNIDCQAARESDLPVFYAPGANAQAVAEYCIGQIIYAARHLRAADLSTRSGEWRREQFVGRSMRELTLGIVGYGHVGQRLCVLADAFGSRTLISSRHLREAPEQGVVDITTLFRLADVVSVHVASTPETRGLVDGHLLSLLKPNAIFLNTARGDVVDEDALFRTAHQRRDCVFILDVCKHEPPTDPRFGALPNVVLTPHHAAFTQHTQSSISELVFSQVIAALQHANSATPLPEQLPPRVHTHDASIAAPIAAASALVSPPHR